MREIDLNIVSIKCSKHRRWIPNCSNDQFRTVTVRVHSDQHAKVAGLQSVGLGLMQTCLVQTSINRNLASDMIQQPWGVVVWVHGWQQQQENLQMDTCDTTGTFFCCVPKSCRGYPAPGVPWLPKYYLAYNTLHEIAQCCCCCSYGELQFLCVWPPCHEHCWVHWIL